MLVTVSLKKMNKGLSQRQLCEYFGWNYKTIALEAKNQGLSTHAYVQQKTQKRGWILREEKYYPLNQTSFY